MSLGSRMQIRYTHKLSMLFPTILEQVKNRQTELDLIQKNTS